MAGGENARQRGGSTQQYNVPLEGYEDCVLAGERLATAMLT